MLIVGPPKQGKSPMMAEAVESFRDIFGESVTVDIIASKDGCYDIERLRASLESLVGEIGRRSDKDRARPHVLAIDDYDLFVMFESKARRQEYRKQMQYILENGSRVGVYLIVTTWNLSLLQCRILDEKLFPVCRILA